MIAKPGRIRAAWFGGLAVAGATALSGCADGYYAQAIGGQLRLMTQRQDIAKAVTEPTTPPDLAARLSLITELVAYADDRLWLPSNGSYRSFVDLDRAFVSWNVIAAPALSLAPLQWCFPVAGCVSYRGYFDEADGEAFADRLRAEGYDVQVVGVRAYSTLGWFDDPVPSTILFDPDFALAGTIFHELSHQRVYIADDTTFNESYANAVELAAVEQWLGERGTPEMRAAYHRGVARQAEFLALVQATRAELAELYASPLDEPTMLARKADIYDDLRTGYARLRASWGGYPGYDAWFEKDLNNAKLALVATYNLQTDAFLNLLDQVGGDWAAFHATVEAIAALPKPERDAYLASLI